ncbi:MAG: hypothetical protein U0359_20660 [Byssovorax sp.]
MVKGGAKCVAAASNDTAPALIALDAELRRCRAEGRAADPLVRDFYTADGIKNTVLAWEIVVNAIVPLVPHRTSAFEKLRKRGAIGFLPAALGGGADRSRAGAARASSPGPTWWWTALSAAARIRAAAGRWCLIVARSAGRRRCAGGLWGVEPLTNLDDEAEWRREMVPVLVREGRAGRRVGRGGGVFCPSASGFAAFFNAKAQRRKGAKKRRGFQTVTHWPGFMVDPRRRAPPGVKQSR